MRLIHWAILMLVIAACLFMLPIDRREPPREVEAPCYTDTECHEMYPDRCPPEESYCF